MIASLPMYDRPETRPAWNRLWELIVEHAAVGDFELPDLTWDAGDADHWLRPDLALSQTCSLPYRTRLQGKVACIGAFDFGLPDCPPGYYNSVLVMREDDHRKNHRDWPELRLAYNAPDSQSGWAAPYFHAEHLGVRFDKGLETGAHRVSAQAVADHRADIAAIDAQTYRLLRRYDPFMESLAEVASTDPTPGLPIITSRESDAPKLLAAIAQAIRALDATDHATLGIKDVVAIPSETYMALPIPPAPKWGGST